MKKAKPIIDFNPGHVSDQAEHDNIGQILDLVREMEQEDMFLDIEQKRLSLINDAKYLNNDIH